MKKPMRGSFVGERQSPNKQYLNSMDLKAYQCGQAQAERSRDRKMFWDAWIAKKKGKP